MLKQDPFDLPLVFASRQITLSSKDGRRGSLLLQLGAPLRDEDKGWLCMWNLLTPDPDTGLVAKGVSEGADQLQALLRSLRVLRAVLDNLSASNEVDLFWVEEKHGGISALGDDIA